MDEEPGMKLLIAYLAGLVTGTYIAAWLLNLLFPDPVEPVRERIPWSRTPAT